MVIGTGESFTSAPMNVEAEIRGLAVTRGLLNPAIVLLDLFRGLPRTFFFSTPKNKK
jgi:hypothetical protein